LESKGKPKYFKDLNQEIYDKFLKLKPVITYLTGRENLGLDDN